MDQPTEMKDKANMKKRLTVYMMSPLNRISQKRMLNFSFLMLAFLGSFCQTEVLNNIKSGFEKYNDKFVHEKIFVHKFIIVFFEARFYIVQYLCLAEAAQKSKHQKRKIEHSFLGYTI